MSPRRSTASTSLTMMGKTAMASISKKKDGVKVFEDIEHDHVGLDFQDLRGLKWSTVIDLEEAHVEVEEDRSHRARGSGREVKSSRQRRPKPSLATQHVGKTSAAENGPRAWSMDVDKCVGSDPLFPAAVVQWGCCGCHGKALFGMRLPKGYFEKGFQPASVLSRNYFKVTF